MFYVTHAFVEYNQNTFLVVYECRPQWWGWQSDYYRQFFLLCVCSYLQWLQHLRVHGCHLDQIGLQSYDVPQQNVNGGGGHYGYNAILLNISLLSKQTRVDNDNFYIIYIFLPCITTSTQEHHIFVIQTS